MIGHDENDAEKRRFAAVWSSVMRPRAMLLKASARSLCFHRQAPANAPFLYLQRTIDPRDRLPESAMFAQHGIGCDGRLPAWAYCYRLQVGRSYVVSLQFVKHGDNRAFRQFDLEPIFAGSDGIGEFGLGGGAGFPCQLAQTAGAASAFMARHGFEQRRRGARRVTHCPRRRCRAARRI